MSRIKKIMQDKICFFQSFQYHSKKGSVSLVDFCTFYNWQWSCFQLRLLNADHQRNVTDILIKTHNYYGSPYSNNSTGITFDCNRRTIFYQTCWHQWFSNLTISAHKIERNNNHLLGRAHAIHNFSHQFSWFVLLAPWVVLSAFLYW